MTVGGACSSGTSDVPDAGGGGDGASSSSSSSSSGASSSGSSGSSSSGSSSGGASDITVIFPFDSATSGTDVANWPGDTYCATQTSLPGTGGGAGDDGGGSGASDGATAEGGDDGGGNMVAVDAAPVEAAAPNTCGTEVFLQSLSTLSFDPDVGDPGPGGDPGSLKIVIPFNGYNQQADFQHIFTTPLQNLAGQTLFVRIQLDSGFVSNASAPGGFVLDVKSTMNYVYAQSAYTNIGMPNPGGWTQYNLNISMPSMSNAGYDPTDIVSMELHFDTGAGPAGGGADAGALPTTATFHVDTIGYFPTPM
ncbi:MAG TPA: hypothetical protein VGM06_16925 [Polyangiaceae bacterium]